MSIGNKNNTQKKTSVQFPVAQVKKKRFFFFRTTPQLCVIVWQQRLARVFNLFSFKGFFIDCFPSIISCFFCFFFVFVFVRLCCFPFCFKVSILFICFCVKQPKIKMKHKTKTHCKMSIKEKKKKQKNQKTTKNKQTKLIKSFLCGFFHFAAFWSLCF